MTIIDEFGNKIFESPMERFITSRGLRAPFWIPFECIKIETPNNIMIAPLDVWVPRAAITHTGVSEGRIYLKSRYIGTLSETYRKAKSNGKQNARVILNNLNKGYKKGGLAPQNTVLSF